MVRQAEHSIQLAKAPFLPSVSLNAAYTKQGDDFLAEDQNTLKIAKELAQMIKLGLEVCKKDGNSSGDKSDRLVTGGNGLT